MYARVCVYVCVCVYMCACVCACIMCACMHMCVHIFMCVLFSLHSRSVTVNRRHSVPKPLPVKSEALDGNSDESMQESAMSIQTSNESMQESAMSIQTSNKNIQESTMSIQTSDSMQESAMSIQTSDSMQESAMSIQTSVVNMHESAVNTRAKPMYTLIRVNRFVEPISGESPLEDGGKCFTNMTVVSLEAHSCSNYYIVLHVI